METVDQRLPVTLLTGFLGAGKTTLLARLLARPHGLRVGLVQNERGVAGIEAPGATGTFVELTEGCACCTRNPDLIAALLELAARGDLDRVLVETSGLADPLALTWTLSRPELLPRVRLDAVVTVVDPVNLAAAGTEEWQAQVRCGNLVVLSKLDLATPAQADHARASIRAVNAAARILEGGAGLPTEVLLDAAPGGPGAGRSATGPAEPEHRHSTFTAASFSDDAAYDLTRLEDLLEALPEAVFRAKGIVRLADGRWASFHAVGGRLELRLGVQPPTHGASRMVFFGPALAREDVEARLAACRA